jgi:1-acyl-sn-glycerol-3-phosphate acyltransferase
MVCFWRVTVLYGDPLRWERVEEPAAEQQQAVADAILVEIKRPYAELEALGRKGVLRRLRAQRSGAGAADSSKASGPAWW